MHFRDLTQFLAELSEQNNRAWFMMNKPRYDILRGEFLTLVSHVITALGHSDPEIALCNPKKALFRINRDMRFSKEKVPYKTYFSASIIPNGLKKPSQGGGPAYYFHIDSRGTLLIAAGEYMPPAGRLLAIRKHVAADGAGFSAVLQDRAMTESFGSLQEEGKLIRAPKGFAPDEPLMEYLKLKNYIVWKEMDFKNTLPGNLEQLLTSQFKSAYPLVKWLRSVPGEAAQ